MGRWWKDCVKDSGDGCEVVGLKVPCGERVAKLVSEAGKDGIRHPKPGAANEIEERFRDVLEEGVRDKIELDEITK